MVKNSCRVVVFWVLIRGNMFFVREVLFWIEVMVINSRLIGNSVLVRLWEVEVMEEVW